jgi:hypothetical protein
VQSIGNSRAEPEGWRRPPAAERLRAGDCVSVQKVRKFRREAPILQADPRPEEEIAMSVRQRRSTGRPAPILIATLLLLSAAASAPGGAAGRAPLKQSGSFQAQWSIVGTQQGLEFGPARSLSIYEHSGTITVVRSDGLVGNALSKCIGLGDTARGDVSRCIWIDSAGEKIFSELTGTTSDRSGTGRGRGTFVGGTGRFEGITGSYEIDWVAVPSLEPEKIESRSLSMQGTWELP